MNIFGAHIVCLSGGEASALVAIEVARKYDVGDIILLNHDISPKSEAPSIKKLKLDVSKYIGVDITYANASGWKIKDQFDVVIEAGAFQTRPGQALCTNRMKTAPFYDWLKRHSVGRTSTVYYGFGADEPLRIQRKSSAMALMGIPVAFPLAHWPRTIRSVSEVGIEKPSHYDTWKHANCIGCLKAGIQHWYVVYCLYPQIFAKAVSTEEQIGHSIIKGYYLSDLVERFERMKKLGVPANENIPNAKFHAMGRLLSETVDSESVNSEHAESVELPCECIT